MGLRRQKYVLVGLDAVLLTVAYVTAFLLRLSWSELTAHVGTIATTLPIVLSISLFVHLRNGLFNAVLRYASLETAVAVARSVMWSVAISCLAIFLLFRLEGVPRSVFLIYAMEALILVGAARIAVRVLRDRRRRHESRSGTADLAPVLLYGAGGTAELVLRGLGSSPELGYAAVGLIDDNPAHKGKQIRGLPIFGGVDLLRGVLERVRVEEVWVCIAGLAGERLRAVYEAATARGVRVKILPRLRHALLGEDLGRFQEPDISDLLRRPPRSLDRVRMKSWLQGRRVLITGAGGSIGSELARQVAALGPESLALCDACEANLFEIHRELGPLHGELLGEPFLVDVRDRAGVARMFRDARPEIVFHAAAYKHVPLVELNPCEGVLTNVAGLCNVALSAAEFGVVDFVFISTDKAVRPANVMGATKRLGELIVQALDAGEDTCFSAVRFGNVLGSSGSVVPIFQEQIQRGGPVTVTHEEMTRYFMLVSEAVELVIQAGSIGRGGEVFILDMGEPVRIADMARDLIRLMGKEPETEVPIRFTGPRPGEKVHEELLIGERDSQTSFEDIWIDGEPPSSMPWGELSATLSDLFVPARGGDSARVLHDLGELVSGFAPTFEETRAHVDVPLRTAKRLADREVAGQRSRLVEAETHRVSLQ